MISRSISQKHGKGLIRGITSPYFLLSRFSVNRPSGCLACFIDNFFKNDSESDAVITDSLLWTEPRLGSLLNRLGWFTLLSKLTLKSQVLGLLLFYFLFFFLMLAMGNSLTNHVNLTSSAMGFNMPLSAMCSTREKLAAN